MTVRLNHMWTVDSGTVELPRVHRGIPLAETPTHELHLLDLVPSVARTRVARPSHWDTLRRYGWLVGLLIAGLLCVLLVHLQALTPATAIR